MCGGGGGEGEGKLGGRISQLVKDKKAGIKPRSKEQIAADAELEAANLQTAATRRRRKLSSLFAGGRSVLGAASGRGAPSGSGSPGGQPSGGGGSVMGGARSSGGSSGFAGSAARY